MMPSPLGGIPWTWATGGGSGSGAAAAAAAVGEEDRELVVELGGIKLG